MMVAASNRKGFEYKRRWYSAAFASLLLSKHRYLISFGGRGCFLGNQNIQTQNGLIPISEINIGDMVYSYNISFDKKELKEVDNIFEYDVDEDIVRVRLENDNTIECTLDHKFWYNDKWVKIKDILYENCNTSRVSKIYYLRKWTNTIAINKREWEIGICKTSKRCKRISSDNAKKERWENSNNKGSQNCSRSFFRRKRIGSKSQERCKSRQFYSELRICNEGRKYKTFNRNRTSLQKYSERFSNRKFKIKRASSFGNSKEIQTVCIYKKNASAGIWGKRLHNKRYSQWAKLGASAIKSFEIFRYKGKVYDIEVRHNHNFYLDNDIIAHNSGKTNHIILKLLASTFSKGHVSVYYCRHEFETIRKTTFKDIKNYLKSKPELGMFFNYSESPNGSMTFTNSHTGNQVIPFGLDDPEKTKGISEATHVWIDEVDKCTEEQFSLVNAVLRTPQADYLQFIGSFNPVSEKSWLRAFFFSEDDAYKPHDRFGSDIYIHHSTVYDNEYIDVEEYVKTLMLTYNGNQTLIDVNVKGLWGQEENKSPWLYAFSREKHVRPTLPFLSSFPVYLSFDFNREPATCIAYQQSPGKGSSSSFLHYIKEFLGDYQLNELCEQIKASFPASILFVTGDAAGNKGDVGFVGRHSTYYTMVQSYLDLMPKQMHINSRNLEHGDSRLLCNVMLNQYPNMLFSLEGCPNLISDCEIAQVDTESNKPGHLKKDRKEFKLDLFDGFRYSLQTDYNDFAKSVYFKIQQKK